MKYQEAINTLGTHDSRKLANNTYLRRRGPKSIAVKLHNTDILTFHPGRTVYDSGGWRTVTTKDRMNRYGPTRVYSDTGIWYLDPFEPFADGITVYDSGRVTHAGPAPKKTLAKRAKVRAYAERFVAKFQAGEIPAPSGRDCWFCLMRTQDGQILGDAMHDRDHIAQHVKERYYVPSLLANACKAGGISQSAQDYLASFWDSTTPPSVAPRVRELYGNISVPQIRKALIKYLYHQMGV